MNPNSSAINVSLLTDLAPRLMDGAAMDYFLIEVVRTVRASSAVASARSRATEQAMIDAGLIPPPPPVPKVDNRDSLASAKSVVGKTGITGAPPPVPPLDEEEEAVRKRLESIGQHVGANITERLCRDRTLFADTLDSIKFVCKDIWVACWDKQVDNLRTNHRGVYVLQDNAFKPIFRLSSWDGRADAVRRARLYVAISAGIIRGALGRLGLQATVVPEITAIPACTFQVKLR